MRWPGRCPRALELGALQFDVSRALLPGWNNFQIIARDSEGFTRQREVWVRSRVEQVFRAKSEASYIVTDDGRMKVQKLLGTLARSGFDSSRVSVLKGKGATAQAFLAAVRESRGRYRAFSCTVNRALSRAPCSG